MEVTRAAKGGALGYAQIVANQTGIGTSDTDVTGLTLTFIVPAAAFWVEFWAPAIAQQGSTGIPIVKLFNGSNQEYSRSQSASLAAGGVWAGPAIRRRISDATPGASITVKIAAITTAGTMDVRAGQQALPSINGPAFIRAYQEA